MEYSQPGRMWLDHLPTAVQIRLVTYATGGLLNEQAVNLANLGFKWAKMVWSTAEFAVKDTIELMPKSDEDLEVQDIVSPEAFEEYGQYLTLIWCFADSETRDFQDLCIEHPQSASKVLRQMKVTSVRIPLQKNLVNDVLASSAIQEVCLTFYHDAIQEIYENRDQLKGMLVRLAALPLKRLRVKGEFPMKYKDMLPHSALASGFARIVSEGLPSCKLHWSVRPDLSNSPAPEEMYELYWKAIELLPSATRLTVFYPVPERLLHKVSSFASLKSKQAFLPSSVLSRVGSILAAYRHDFWTCPLPPREGHLDLRNLLHCTQVKKLRVQGCWHLLAKLAPVIKNMVSILRLELNICAISVTGGEWNVCEVDSDYLPRTSQFFQSIAHIEEVDFSGRYLNLSDCKQVLELLGTRLRRLALYSDLDSRSLIMDYVEEVLLTILSCNPRIHGIRIVNFVEFDSSNEHESSTSQEKRIHALANKLDEKNPMLNCTASIIECLSSPPEDDSS